ncbi:MAG: hypothetical protein JXB48_07935, partial [Candidatus Latescibacteria bacterium]|nr:hypothetical protein [Candidatus Latescibacterota bacterium]
NTPHYRYRVGISYGEFYHNKSKNIYVGKALVEASELEKIQQWSGASLTNKAAEKIVSPESSVLVDYNVPLKNSEKRKYKVINWTQANHHPTLEKQNWMYREENGNKVNTYSDSDVEQKILNTEQFHFDKCSKCRNARKNMMS